MPPANSYHKKGSGVLIAVIAVLVIALVGALGFGLWAFGGMQDYKNNVDQKIQTAIVVANQKLSTQKDNEFIQKEKSPYKTYQGPDTYGSISFRYPKTWSGYVDTTNNSTPVDGYFQPGVVPGISSSGSTAYALRVQVLGQSYDQVMGQYQAQVQSGKLKISAYRAPKVKSVLGSLVRGEVNPGQSDTMVVLQLRDKTIEVWVEADQYVKDLNAVILPSFSFSP